MALTSTQSKDAYQFFIVAFGAAPGVEYLNQLDDAYGAGMTTKEIVNVYATKPQFLAQYPSFLSNEQFADKLIENVVGASATAAAKTQAKADVVGALNDRWTKGDVVFQIFTNLANKPTTDALWGATAQMFNNKVEVAQYATETLLINTTDLAQLRALVANVTAAPASVDAAKAVAAGATGQTFTLTANVDNVVGTAGDDTIIAGPGSAGGVHTLGASDVINGGAGADKIIITSAATGAEALVPRMSNVEQVFVQAVGTVGATVNLINTTGVQQLWSDNSTIGVAVTNLQEKATIGVKGGNGSNYTVQAAASARTGDLAIALDTANVGNLIVNSTGAAGGAGYTSTTINAATGNNAITGAAGTATSQIGTLDVGAALATVKVTGDGAVHVVNNLAATVRTIDASANKGGVNFNITNNTGNVTFTGGEGADRINFGGTLNLSDKVDGGAGRDILGVTDQSSIIAGLQVSNVEILELNTLNGTLEAARIAGVDEVRVTNTLADVSGTAIVNGLTSNSTFVTNDSGDVRLNITNAQVAGTNDTLNLKTGIAGAGNVNVMAAGVETVAYTQNNAANNGANTTVNFYDTDGVIDMTKLTIANNAGNTVNFNGLVNTIKTVDASAANGAVNVSVNAGNPTSGVEITGGAGADRLIGGDGKDIIVGGAGNDRIQGDVAVATAATPGVTTIDFTAAFAANPTNVALNITGGSLVAPVVVGAQASAPALAAAAMAALNAAGLTATVSGNVVTITTAPGTIAQDLNVASTTVPAPVATTGASSVFVPAVTATAASSTLTFNQAAGTFVAGNAVAYNLVDGDGSTTQAVEYTVLPTDIVAGDGAATAANVAAGVAAAITATAGATNSYTAVRVGNVVTITSTNAGQTGDNQSWTPALDAINNTATGVTLQEVSNGVDGALASESITIGNYGALPVGSTLTAQLAGVTAIINGTGAVVTGANIAAALDAADTSGSTTVFGVYTAGATLALTTANATVDTLSFSQQNANAAGTVVDTPVNGQLAGSVVNAASDTLTGGAGNDTFVLVGQSGGWNGTALTNMDTITDLNLGGAVANVGVDTIQLSAAVLGYAAFNASSLVNAGTAVALTGPTFEAALQGLFNAGGALAGSTNNVGLFTYGSDSYLIAANAATGLDANDIVIKVTGVAGALDLSDITIA